MIVNAVVGFVLGAVRTLVGALPSWSPPTDALSQQAASIGGMAGVVNGYFPILLLGSCAAVVLAVFLGLRAWRVVVFIYHQFWGSE